MIDAKVDVRGYARLILEGDALRGGERATFATLTLYVNAHTAETFASARTLARALAKHPGTIRRHLTAITAAGVVIAEKRPGRTTIYRFPIRPVDAVEDIHNPAHQAAGSDAAENATPRTSARHPAHQRAGVRAPVRDVNSQETVRETPDADVAAVLGAVAAGSAAFYVPPDIYPRIGHRLGPNARPIKEGFG